MGMVEMAEVLVDVATVDDGAFTVFRSMFGGELLRSTDTILAAADAQRGEFDRVLQAARDVSAALADPGRRSGDDDRGRARAHAVE